MIDLASVSSLPGIFPATHRLTIRNHWDHILARIGVRRGSHRVEPGLYALGNPGPGSPVFVSANYTLSFDALRSSLEGIDGYILVLDTKGINVWCAAGKGTFSTDEIALRVMITRLGDVVTHRKLILPQLGAPGVSAHEVKKRTGFWVEYGPVLAKDLPDYLKNHQATPEMRQVKFPLRSRLVLIPVDFVNIFLPSLLVAALLYFLAGWVISAAAATAVFAGIVLFPILLPWLPTHNFSTKGFFLGILCAIPFAAFVFFRHPEWIWWRQVGQALEFLLAIPAVTAFIALNFTGSSTFTSRSGVRREMFAYIPAMTWTFGIGILLAIAFLFIR
jgi:hypothetical protein